ncbi:MAG: hypothetical protein ACI9SJ_001236 [Flavobacteriaceae bacterium]|jgi:hypothetical protein|uniref:hypothetical protein n=1 Tax=Candidatus Marifrigoribacter sp. Uisw_064 TaxID=3230970 RepID=UPI003AE1E7EC
MKPQSTIVSLLEIILGLVKRIIGKPKKQEVKINTSTLERTGSKDGINSINDNAVAFAELLKKNNSKITSSTDITWSSTESVEALKTEINIDIIAIFKGDFSSLSTYNSYFLPTGDFQ